MERDLNNMEEIKIENINIIFDLIRNHDEITRVMLASMAGLTRMSVTRIVGLLMDKKMVYEEGEITASRGRPAIKLHVNSNALYSFSAYIDVDRIKVAVINLKNEILMKDTIDASGIFSMEDYVDSIYEIFEKWKGINPYIIDRITCIAFACPGIIEPMSGEIVLSAQLGWRHTKISEYASSKFGIKTIVDNDVKSALLGEVAFVNKKDKSSIAHMCIGYGVGVGLWIDGKILRGTNNNAGEIGHISIDLNGELCKCGRRGCLDTLLNIESFLIRAKSINKTVNTVTDISNKYRDGEEWAIELVDDASRYFAIAINNIVYAYDPDKIIVGGKFFEMFPNILDIMISSRYFRTYSEFMKNIHIEPSTMGEDSYLIGGAINSQKWVFEKEFIF